MDKILSEVDKLSAFEHPNIVRCYGLTIRKEPHKDYVMFMEWAEGGTLENFMHGEGWENRNASDVARLNWMLQLANVNFKTIYSYSHILFSFLCLFYLLL